jgi:L-iditol 2-dehydrogenase
VDYKLEEARRLGAAHTINSRSGDPVEEIRRLTSGEGADVSLEAVGFPPTVDLAVRAVRKGGRCVLIGNLTPRLDFPLQVLVQRELDVRGTVASAGEYPACLDLIASGRLDVKSLMSKTVPLEEGPHWFHLLHEGKERLFKVILKP